MHNSAHRQKKHIWLLGSTSTFAQCDPNSTRVHRDSACHPPTEALRSSLTLAGLQNDVSRVNEDGDVAVGCAVCRQEALDCLHLLQNSDETKHINTSYLSVSHHKVIKACTCAWTPSLCLSGRVTVKGRLHQLAKQLIFITISPVQYNESDFFFPSVFPDPSFWGCFIVKIFSNDVKICHFA